MIAKVLLSGVQLFIQVLIYAIIIQALLSWVLPPLNPIRQFLMRFTDPLCRPFRRITDKWIKKGLRIDLAPFFAILALQLISILLSWAIPKLFL